jgi:dipicolinate synthase subunit B
MNIGFALCGSFCTYSEVFPVMELLSRDYHVTPIFSQASYTIDSRFGTSSEHIQAAMEICGTPPLHTIAQVEPIGPKKLFDILVIAPCTGNTLAKLAHSIADGPVTMAAKSHLRNGRPVLVAVSTNDGLAGAAENIGKLLSRKHYYFVPFGQDNAATKPTSLVADFSKIPQALEEALAGRQMQPVLL